MGLKDIPEDCNSFFIPDFLAKSMSDVILISYLGEWVVLPAAEASFHSHFERGRTFNKKKEHSIKRNRI